jgi:hypothetical protein
VRWFASDEERVAAGMTGAIVLGQSYRAEAPADKLSFHSASSTDVEAAIRTVEDELGAHGSLRGFAIHSHESYRLLTD